jgi:hypothetical protein
LSLRERQRRVTYTAIVAMALGAAGCDGGKTEYMGAHTPFAACDTAPTAPPAALGLDSFYAKYLDGYGTPVVSSAKVNDRALRAACQITGEMVSASQPVRKALADNHFHVAVIGTSEVATDIPEYADLYTAFPDGDWDNARALGPTYARPVSSCSEENLLCGSTDISAGETVLVQMVAHGLRDLGITEVDAQFQSKLDAAFKAATDNGRWANTPVLDNASVYWALGAQAWYGVDNRLPAQGRAAVTQYDPALAALLATYLPTDDWRPGCY